MNKDDFEKLFSGITPDNFQDKLLEVKEKLTLENESFINTIETLKQKDNDIAKLRDTNQRLFLRVSESVDTTTPDDPADVTIDDIINNFN